MNFDKFEHSFCLDERGTFESLPITCLQAEILMIGGLWGGRLLNFDIIDDKVEAYSKHSETVTALVHSELSRTVASGSVNGEVIVWEYNNKMKVLYKHKMVHHASRVNHISI